MRGVVLALLLVSAATPPGTSWAGPGTAFAPEPAKDRDPEQSGAPRQPGWADELLNFFSGGRGTGEPQLSCPSGMMVCCCGDQCYCKRECSFKACR